MRREQVLKICANHNIRSDMELTKKNDRAWMWVALDFADEEVRLEQLCVRFKTVDEAANFKDAFVRAKMIVADSEASPVKNAGSVSTPPLTQQSSKIATKVVASPVSPSVPDASSNKITVGGFTFASPPTFKIDSKPAAAQASSKDPMKDKEKGSLEAAKPSPFASFSFTSPPKTSTPLESPVVTVSTSVYEPAQLRRPHTTVPKPAVTVAYTASDVTQGTPKSDTGSTQIPSTNLMFDSPHSDLTFSALAAGSKETAFKKDDSFKGWEGAGKSVFGKSVKSEGLDDGEGGTEEFVPTAEFKPLVPLPDLVELKTGEEGENILFEERAKLLRFDSEGKQWKERGVGKVKVMQNPTTGKVRILMRREQVFKVCCNHFVTADMKFTALSSSDRAWTWYAQDFSEGKMKLELLAIRFKTVDQALSFKKTLDEVQLKMSERDKDTNKSTIQHGKSLQATVWKCKECLFPNASDVNHCLSCKETRPRQFKESPVYVSHGSNQQPKLLELSKSSDSWDCQSCFLKNDYDSETCLGCKKPKSSKATTVPSAPETKPLSELFKAKPGSWECKSCYIRNPGTADLCVACESSKPGSNVTPKHQSSFSFGGLPKSDPNTAPLSELFKPETGSWECKDCYTRNSADKTCCLCCSAPKPGHKVTQKEKPDNSPNQPSFKFGMPSSGIKLNFGTSSQTTIGQSDFTFGIATGGTSEPVQYKFGMPTANTSTSTAASTGTTTTATVTTQSLFASSNVSTPKGGFTFGLPSSSASSVTTIFGAEGASTKPFLFEPKTTTGAFLFGSSAGDGTGGSTSSLTFSFGSSIQEEGTQDTAPSKDTPGEIYVRNVKMKSDFNSNRILGYCPMMHNK